MTDHGVPQFLSGLAASAQRLARMGFRLDITGRRSDPLDETVAAIHAAGEIAHARRADLRDANAVAALFADVARLFSRLDLPYIYRPRLRAR